MIGKILIILTAIASLVSTWSDFITEPKEKNAAKRQIRRKKGKIKIAESIIILLLLVLSYFEFDNAKKSEKEAIASKEKQHMEDSVTMAKILNETLRTQYPIDDTIKLDYFTQWYVGEFANDLEHYIKVKKITENEPDFFSLDKRFPFFKEMYRIIFRPSFFFDCPNRGRRAYIGEEPPISLFEKKNLTVDKYGYMPIPPEITYDSARKMVFVQAYNITFKIDNDVSTDVKYYSDLENSTASFRFDNLNEDFDNLNINGLFGGLNKQKKDSVSLTMSCTFNKRFKGEYDWTSIDGFNFQIDSFKLSKK